MPGFERPPADMETKTAALAAPTGVRAAALRHREIHQAVIGPTGVECGGDILHAGALARGFARREVKVVLGADWNRPVGRVLSSVEVGPGDRRLPARTAQGRPGRVPAGPCWPASS